MAETGSRLAVAERHLPLPATAEWGRIRWSYAIGVGGVHVLALLAFVPRLFDWTRHGLALAGLMCSARLASTFATIGCCTHRGYRVPSSGWSMPWPAGRLLPAGHPGRWVSVHRLPPSALRRTDRPAQPACRFLVGAYGLADGRQIASLQHLAVRAIRQGLCPTAFYGNWRRQPALGMDRTWPTGRCSSSPASPRLGPAGDTYGGVHSASSLLVWGVFVRTVLVWHITWSVNSLTHLWGYRNYETDDNSRNNLLVGLVSNGEGWHNNHHAQPVGRPRPLLVGAGRDLADHPPAGAARPGVGRRPARREEGREEGRPAGRQPR